MRRGVRRQPDRRDKREAETADADQHEASHRRPPLSDCLHRCERPRMHGVPGVGTRHSRNDSSTSALTSQRSPPRRQRCGRHCVGTCEDDANHDRRTHMARDTDRRHQCSRIRRIILPALALSGALALAGCAIQTSSDLGSTSECGDFNPATEPCPLSP
jgi:hypothetical protein